MSSRERLVEQLAPVAPPCFESRSIWISYLKSAAEAQKTDGVENSTTVVLIFRQGERPQFNHRFAYCRDCAAKHAHAMHIAGLCKPKYLLEMPLKQAVREQQPIT
ncbi:hypothetical protein PEC18_18680 [Paucibacter sp. O1-1]|nr:hypothetical protein [Paucibacter sp. O1-1]MDA3827824.1 hypothetical protein [Paucibacter sp. O1-1]